MRLISKIKTTFPDEVLKLLGSLCDTHRIGSNQKKMMLVQQLLKKYEIRYSPLGGATNRFVLLIDGYVFKFALDRQGFKDNLMEYAISKELQPYVTKSYETNGYILVAETVKTMTLDDFKLRRTDILKVLELLCADYLLGDVGYITKNFANWGIRDDGKVVILDYAYCHRGTEKLFVCDVCGNGILAYDSTFSYLRCSNAASGCQAKYSYIDRKIKQGDKVDLDMIDESKACSIVLPKGISERNVSEDGGVLQNANLKIIKTASQYAKYLKEVNHMYTPTEEESNDLLDLLTQKAAAKTDAERALIEKQIAEIEVGSEDEDEYVVDLDDENEAVPMEKPVIADEDDEDGIDNNTIVDDSYSVDDMVTIASGRKTVVVPSQESDNEPEPEEEDDDCMSLDEMVKKAISSNTDQTEEPEEETEQEPVTVCSTPKIDEGCETTDEETVEESEQEAVREAINESAKTESVVETEDDQTSDDEAGESPVILNGEPV